MKSDNINKFINKAIRKMFQVVGATHEYSAEFCKTDNWYMSHTWNTKQINTYKRWFVAQARKDLKWTKKTAESEWGWFFLQWGWATPHHNEMSKS